MRQEGEVSDRQVEESIYVLVPIGKWSDAVIVLLRIEPLKFTLTPATKTHIRVYTELIVVPCVV